MTTSIVVPCSSSSVGSSSSNSSNNSPNNSPARSRLYQPQHRVLIYATCYNVLDGVTLTIRKLEEEILAAGHAVCILTTVSGDPANTHLVPEHANRRVIFMDNAIPIPFVHDPNNPALTYQLGFSLSRSIKDQIAQFEPSIIHITCPDCTALHLIQYARTVELPIMGTYHSNIPEYMEHYPGLSWLKHVLAAFFRHQYNFLQGLYVPTPYIQRHLVDHYQMDRAVNLQVWGRGVDVVNFHPSKRCSKYRRDCLGVDNENTPIILFVGRLVPEKRPDLFAAIVKQLFAAGIDFHALVVGAGPCEDEIKALPNTTFAGWMTPEQLAVAYACADVFLFPSAVETFGNVTLEAAASGLPVVVEQGCSGHLVADNGYAVEADDEEGFYQATVKLCLDAKLRTILGHNSRKLAERLEKRAVVRQMLDHYSSITEEFYTEYGGHHANRDEQWNHAGSFLAGRHPRPLLLVLVEYLFIVTFQVIWNMTGMFMYMQEVFVDMQRPSSWQAVEQQVVAEEAGQAAAVQGDASHVVVVVESHNSTTTSTAVEKAVTPTLARLPTDNSIVELSDVELGQDPLSHDEDASVASSAASSLTTATGATTNSSCFSCLSLSSNQSFGDCKLSHALAKAFVYSMYVQCRIESQFRTSCSRACFSSAASGTHFPKRKNSSCDLELPVASLACSRTISDASSCAAADEELSVVASLAKPQHRMRRSSNYEVV